MGESTRDRILRIAGDVVDEEAERMMRADGLDLSRKPADFRDRVVAALAKKTGAHEQFAHFTDAQIRKGVSGVLLPLVRGAVADLRRS